MQEPTTEEEARARIAWYSRVALVGEYVFLLLGFIVPALAILARIWTGDNVWLFVIVGTEIVMVFAAVAQAEVEEARFRIEESIIQGETQRDPNPPILLLRSFTNFSLSLNASVKPPGKYPWVRGDTFLHPLAEACLPLGRVVAIGSVPAVSVADSPWLFVFEVDDANWVEVFTAFARASRAIVVLPGITPGAVHEIKTLVSGNLLEKTLVVMPPVSKPTPGMFSRDGVREAWDEARGFWGEQGAFLPEYDPEGMVYLPNPDLSIRRKEGLEGSLSTLQKAATVLIADVPPGAKPLRDLMSEMGHLYLDPREKTRKKDKQQ